MRTLTLGELRTGDILISYYAKPGIYPAVENQLFAQHVSLVTGRHDSGAVLQIHNTNTGARGENHLFVHRTSKWSGTIRNDVVVPKSHPTSELEAGDQLRVLRCKNTKLAERAAFYATLWSGYEIPYAESKLSKATLHEKKLGSNSKIVEVHRMLFEKYAKFRAIKYAARRNGYLCYPDGLDSDVGLKHGMICSGLIAVCFQVAGLEPLVKAVRPTGCKYKVTDKKMCLKDLELLRHTFGGNPKDLESYLEYTKHLHHHDPYELDLDWVKSSPVKKSDQIKPKRFVYAPSIALWKGVFDRSITDTPWAEYITRGMMLDSKTIMPTGLFACLIEDKDSWDDMGYLVGDRKFSETPEEKERRLRKHAKMVDELRKFTLGEGRI